MALLENDVSWQVLRRILKEWAGSAAELDEVQALAGGSINTTLLLTAVDGLRAVLKVSSHRVNRDLMREAHQLKLMQNLGIPCPMVFAEHLADLDQPDSWILLEYVQGEDLHKVKEQCSKTEYDVIQEDLAEICIAMHQEHARKYGRVGDEQATPNWPDFFHMIYDSLWKDVREAKLLTSKTMRNMEKVHEKLEVLLEHDDKPRLIHGDFWASNILARKTPAGKWRIAALLDPNLKYAHVESEMAYLELFHTVTPAFLRRYEKAFPLSHAYHRYRKDLYQLYDLLDHIHLFGNEYIKPFQKSLNKVMSEIGE
jgi:fructosamine-3-kinase